MGEDQLQDNAGETEPKKNEEAVASEAAPGNSPETAAKEATAGAEGKEEAASLRAEIERLQAHIKVVEDALKRERADFINYRQRLGKEMEKMVLQAKRSLLLEVADLAEAFLNTDKGLEAHKDFKSLVGAYKMVRGHFEALLKRWEIEVIGKVGEPFDVLRHEVLNRVEDPSVSSPVVREVVKPGFSLPGLVIRPAHVVVAGPPAKSNQEAGGVSAESKREDIE
jgi:molecular chaperone GrpE